jgi:hypothetical protein
MMQDEGTAEVLHGLIKIKVGNGRRVYFWKDKWIDGRMVEDIAPGILAAVPTRWKNCRTVDMALHSNRWMLDITGALSEVEYRQLVDLWLAIDLGQGNKGGGPIQLDRRKGWQILR